MDERLATVDKCVGLGFRSWVFSLVRAVGGGLRLASCEWDGSSAVGERLAAVDKCVGFFAGKEGGGACV